MTDFGRKRTLARAVRERYREECAFRVYGGGHLKCPLVIRLPTVSETLSEAKRAAEGTRLCRRLILWVRQPSINRLSLGTRRIATTEVQPELYEKPARATDLWVVVTTIVFHKTQPGEARVLRLTTRDVRRNRRLQKDTEAGVIYNLSVDKSASTFADPNSEPIPRNNRVTNERSKPTANSSCARIIYHDSALDNTPTTHEAGLAIPGGCYVNKSCSSAL